MPENNQKSTNAILRERVIECMKNPELAPIYARLMLRDTREDPFYLVKFIGMNQNRLTVSHINETIKKVALLKDPASLYLLFYLLKPTLQAEFCEDIAWELITIDNEYYLGKFAYYCRYIATHLGEIRTLRLSYRCIDDNWIDGWMNQIKAKNSYALSDLIRELENSDQPIKSPDDKIIKNRDGFEPKYIVLHSAGAASPIERIAYNFLSPESAPVSAHFVVTRDGKVYQFVDLKDAARTNGTSDDPSKDNYYGFSRHPFFSHIKENANNFCVTIECEEFGYKGMLNPEQYTAVLSTLALINQECHIPITRETILGHHDIAPFSKWYCPGECFPLNKLIRDLKKPITPVKPLTPDMVLEFD